MNFEYAGCGVRVAGYEEHKKNVGHRFSQIHTENKNKAVKKRKD